MNAQKVSEHLDVSMFKANQILLVIRGRVNPLDYPKRFPKTNSWVKCCYNLPKLNEIRLEAISEVIGGFGTEAIEVEGFFHPYYRNLGASYVNTGDTYSPTILLDHIKQVWKLTTWGDWIEKHN